MSICDIKTPIVNNQKDAYSLEQLLKGLETDSNVDSNEKEEIVFNII